MNSKRIIRVKPAPVRQALAEKKAANAPRYAVFDTVTILEEVVVRNRPPQVFTVLAIADVDEKALAEGREANPSYRLRSMIDGHDGVIRQNLMSPVSEQYLVFCMSFYMGVHAKLEAVYERMRGDVTVDEEGDEWVDEEDEDAVLGYTEHNEPDGTLVRTYGRPAYMPGDDAPDEVVEDDEEPYTTRRQGTTRGGI